MISPGVPVDRDLDLKGNERERYYLKPVNKQSRQLAARTVWEIARGAFSQDSEGKVYYEGNKVPKGFCLPSWDKYKPLYQRPVEPLIKPKSVAVVGASAKGGIGQAIIRNLKDGGFEGGMYAVNRKAEDVLGVSGYASILDIPEDVDMAVLAIPSSSVVEIAQECGKKQTKVVVCISAGFKETGEEGKEQEKKLLDTVHYYNMRLIGPNCMGIANTDRAVSLNANILQSAPPKGNIGFITQSGALGAAMVDFAEELGLGFSIIASLGNQADLNCNDLLMLMEEDVQTEVVLLYMESIPEPGRFKKWVKRLAKRKPVIMIKAGRTEAGALAASSHTGSLAGKDQVVAALLKQSGAVRVRSLSEAFAAASALAKMPKVKGKKAGVITNAGGPGILVSDALHDNGFELPLLAKQAQEKLAEKLLPEAAVRNPIDLVAPAPPKHYAQAVKVMMKEGGYDALLVVCVPPATIDTGEVARTVVGELQETDMPVLTCFFGPNLGAAGREVMLKAGIPTFSYPEELANILCIMREASFSAKSATREISSKQKPEELPPHLKERIIQSPPGKYLPSPLCREILQAYGFNMVQSYEVASAKQIQTNEFPVVAKIHHPELIHKTDEGGLVMNLQDERELEEAVDYLLRRFPGAKGVEIQRQIPPGKEVILGAVKDSLNGHGVMVGIGGTQVELYKDIAFGHAPLHKQEAEEIIRSLKGYPLLSGYRGQAGVNVGLLSDLMVRLSWLLMEVPQIAEMDLNPLIYDAKQDDFVIVDYRIRLAGSEDVF